MPIPKLGQKEDQKKFIARCMRFMAERDSGRPQKQQIAICFTAWRRKK